MKRTVGHRAIDRGELSRLLRAGDPAPPGSELTTEERRGMLRQLRAATGDRPVARARGRTSLPLALVWAGALLLAVGLAVTMLRPRHVPPDAAVGPRPDDHEAREIQFTTPGGTFVVWTLDPDFSL